MKVLLTSMCTGKTSLEKHHTRYVDLDIFANVKTQRQIGIIQQMVANFAAKCDEECIYMFNMDRFYKYGLENIPSIKIIAVAVPEEEAFSYYEKLFIERENKENGGVRQRAFDCFCKSLRLNKKKAEELEKQGVPVIYLKWNLEGGPLLKNFLLQNKEPI